MKLERHKKMITNQDEINSLKRPFKFCFLETPIAAFMVLLISVSITGTNCDVICQKDTSFMYPCSCNNGTQGLLIRCAQLNLAVLSNSLKRIQDPIESIQVEESSISRLAGPIFNNSIHYPSIHSSLRELGIRSSGLRQIDSQFMSAELTKSLQYFQLDANQLQQVPTNVLNEMTNLRGLNLSSNQISFIESNYFVKLLNLTELDLSWNKISRLAKNSFNSLYALEYLNLNGNEISKLEKNLFNFGRKLRHLDLSNNKLTSLDRQDFSELTNLETLSVANNQLTTLPRSIFSRNAKLYNLDLSFNKLEDIDTYLLKSVRFLKDLNMSGNLIKELTKNIFSPTTRIKRINMSQNQLQSLGPETFKGLEWLEKVDLSHNQIVNISNDAFNHIYSVDIDLSHNRLTRIFYWAFHDVSNITKLNLSHNLLIDGISLIAFEQADCAQLDLSYNQIEDISKIPISNFTGIRILDISHNQITELNKKSFTQKTPLYELQFVDASYNNISQISGNILERLRSIRYMNFSHNSLRRLTSGGFGNSPTLLELDLSYNNLVEVVAGTLVGLVSLKNLDISYNRLKKMIPIPVALNSIHLEHNEISQLSRAAFPSLNSLLELYLDHNRVSQIEEGTFGTLLALNRLSLGYNNLSSVPATALKDLTSLQYLSMEGNNIQRLARRAFGTLPIVFELSLDHNNISSISDHAFDGMLQLLKLNLSSNNIQELPSEAFKGLVSLRLLDMSNNRLNRIENKTRSAMEDLLSLEVANFSSNKLSMITGKTFLSSPYIPYKLRHLDLSNNLIGIVVNNFADGMRRVEWLSIRNNIINEIQPNVLGNATHLRYIDLSFNRLRTLKDGTFAGHLVNVSTIQLNNNKISHISPNVFTELEQMKLLSFLDLSSNRLDTFTVDFMRWIKRGMILDLRQNNIECNCDQMPFISWIDSVRARNQSYMIRDASVTDSASGNSNKGSHLSKLVSQYLLSSQLVANLSCSRPESLSGKSIMQLIDLTTTNKDLSCDSNHLTESDVFRRLKAAIQINGVESFYDGEQQLRIGWNLVDPRIDLLRFVIIEAEFKRPFELSLLRSNRRDLSINSYGLVGLKIHRESYDRRSTNLKALNTSGFYLICVTYESGNSSEVDIMIENLEASTTLLANASSQSAANTLDNMISDFTRINCMDLKSLLHHDISEKLISGSSTIIRPSVLDYRWILVACLAIYNLVAILVIQT